ncbi:hemerythrin domain-containing protein [Roseateles sp. DAIF2]|uniref:hemerythrin domain-containing protein n=1 Tax=Roseateles sp. DAIF2 TaxID=2714952 RepID=UPI0018A33681|nr:hemerythrin domain-containing protein [Roseateles sp. DAIF2]QPF72788.1 hemerythrin domain-containing protein [Roseateles sp. DAIF2]
MSSIRFSPPPTTPLQPGGSYAAPFELLAACHERVVRSLDLLERLLVHLERQGGVADATARDAAADVRRYFGLAAPLHHQDEERHLFPALEAGGDAAAAALCTRLREQHREMAELWGPLDAALAALDDLPRLRRLTARFLVLQRGHLRSEDEGLFPAAAALLDAQAQRAMGLEMAARRGLELTGSAAPGSR